MLPCLLSSSQRNLTRGEIALLGRTPEAGGGHGGGSAEGTHPPPPAPAHAPGSWDASPLLAAFNRIKDINRTAAGESQGTLASGLTLKPVPTEPGGDTQALLGEEATAGAMADVPGPRPDPLVAPPVNAPKPMCTCGGVPQAAFASPAAGILCTGCRLRRKHGSRVWRCDSCSCYIGVPAAANPLLEGIWTLGMTRPLRTHPWQLM